MRFKIGGLAATILLLFATSSRAQIYSLEEESRRADQPAKPNLEPERINAAAIPFTDPGDQANFNKTYTKIFETVKENRLDEAYAEMDKLDIITKQKIVDRMIRENPVAQ